MTTQNNAFLIYFVAKTGNHDWSTVGLEKLLVRQLVSKFARILCAPKGCFPGNYTLTLSRYLVAVLKVGGWARV
jgi:hypothetical protein